MESSDEEECSRKRKKMKRTRVEQPFNAINPMYREPFNHGWKRELVCRYETAGRDVYYYPPENQAKIEYKRPCSRTNLGLRLRSPVDVAVYLKASGQSNILTRDNFTFAKQPLGINDPEKEVIRTSNYSRAQRDRRKIDSNIYFGKRRKRTKRTVKKVQIKRKHRKKVAGVASSMALAQTQISPTTFSASHTEQPSKRKSPKSTKRSPATSTEHTTFAFQQESSATRKSQRIMARISTLQSRETDSQLCPEVHQTIFTKRLVKSESVPQTRKALGGSDPDTSFYEKVSYPLQDISFITVTPTSTDYSTMESPSTQNFDPVKSSIPFSSESPMKSAATESDISNTWIEDPMIECQDQTDLKSGLANKDFDSESGIMSIDTEVETKTEPDLEPVDVGEFLIQNHEGEVHAFKVYIKKKDDPDHNVQIRRFSIQFQDDFIYSQLCDTLRNYPDLVDENFTLHWTDPEGDHISVTTDIDLREAMTMKRDDLTRLYLTVLDQ